MSAPKARKNRKKFDLSYSDLGYFGSLVTRGSTFSNAMIQKRVLRTRAPLKYRGKRPLYTGVPDQDLHSELQKFLPYFKREIIFQNDCDCLDERLGDVRLLPNGKLRPIRRIRFLEKAHVRERELTSPGAKAVQKPSFEKWAKVGQKRVKKRGEASVAQRRAKSLQKRARKPFQLEEKRIGFFKRGQAKKTLKRSKSTAKSTKSA